MDHHKKRGRLRRWFLATFSFLAVGYPVALLLAVLTMRFVGDDWWVTSVALYLPRVGFALPLPGIALVLAWGRRWRLLGLQVVSLWLLLFPLMGLTLSWRGYPADGEPSLRLLTYNVNSGNGGFRELADEIVAHSPDVVFIEELPEWRVAQMKAQLAPLYKSITSSDEFLVASKFRIVSSETAAPIPFFGRVQPARFMRFVLETPLGEITAYDLHTISPRGGFTKLRGQGLRREALSGRLLQGQASHKIEGTAALRALQVQAVAEMAARDRGPVVIVGDTNLPTLSGARARSFGHFQDGFAEAGLGFGYTYPSKWPWMRIDLILANQQLDFRRVEVGSGRASDHLCVFGDLVLRKR